MKVICLTWAGQCTHSASAAMVNTYLALEPIFEHAVFQVRLGLSVADLAHNTHDTQPVIRMIEHIALNALNAHDAYAARDARTHRTPSPLTETAAHALDRTIQAAGLGITMAPRLLDNLMHSVQKSETALAAALGTDSRTYRSIRGVMPR